jgi:hypothetical protein
MAAVRGSDGFALWPGGVIRIDHWSLVGRNSVELTGPVTWALPRAGDRVTLWLRLHGATHRWMLATLYAVVAVADRRPTLRVAADCDWGIWLVRELVPQEVSMEEMAWREGVWGPYADYLREYGDPTLGDFLAGVMCADAQKGR